MSPKKVNKNSPSCVAARAPSDGIPLNMRTNGKGSPPTKVYKIVRTDPPSIDLVVMWAFNSHDRSLKHVGQRELKEHIEMVVWRPLWPQPLSQHTRHQPPHKSPATIPCTPPNSCLAQSSHASHRDGLDDDIRGLPSCQSLCQLEEQSRNSGLSTRGCTRSAVIPDGPPAALLCCNPCVFEEVVVWNVVHNFLRHEVCKLWRSLVAICRVFSMPRR